MEEDNAIPDLMQSRMEWFEYWDDVDHGGDGSGALTQKQVVRALSKTFRQFEKRQIQDMLDGVWADFDTNASGAMNVDDLMKPQLGLIDTVHLQMMWSRSS